MPRENRRDDLLDAALKLFVEQGYDRTSVSALAEATGLTKAAFVYHFSSKEDLLFELSQPLLDELDTLLDQHQAEPDPDEPVRAVLDDYLDALCRHRDVAAWIDGDKSVLNHGDLGARLSANNRRAHRLLCRAHQPSRTDRARASAVLGMLWRPVRNGYLHDDPTVKRAVVDLAAAAARRL